MKNFLEKVLINSNYRLFMLSNVDASHINFIDKNFPYVKNVKKRILSYKVKTVKPESKIYKELIKKYKIDPKESIFIDDLKNNILAAKELGFNTIQYTSHKKFLKEFNNLIK
ncbi:MAG: HAD-IA family hydrolase [Ignavibacteria bacterium]